MMRTIKAGLTVGMLVAGLALASGCGDNDNSDNGNDNGGVNPTPIRTSTPGAAPTSTPGNATPVPTATGGGGTTDQTVTFNLAATEAVEGFKITVTYPTAKGGFAGSADAVECTTSGDGIFVPNDNDNGTLQLVAAKVPGTLTFPQTITCTFEATSTLAASDLTATVSETTQNGGQAGDPSVVTVTTNVS
jgi:hypothetical protein